MREFGRISFCKSQKSQKTAQHFWYNDNDDNAPESNLVHLSVSFKSIPCVSRMGVMYSRVRESTFFTSLTYVLL